MAQVLENIYDIIKIKEDLRYLIHQVGGSVGDDFSTYCDELRRLIALAQIDENENNG